MFNQIVYQMRIGLLAKIENTPDERLRSSPASLLTSKSPCDFVALAA
jgi:hypothetical protein